MIINKLKTKDKSPQLQDTLKMFYNPQEQTIQGINERQVLNISSINMQD